MSSMARLGVARFAIAIAVAGLAALIVAQNPANAEKAAAETAAQAAWQEIGEADWKVPVAADLMDIVAPAYQGFPESDEGRQRLAVELARSGDGEGYTATVTKEGLLDDAVGAEQIRLKIARRAANWGLVRAERRWQCRRGAKAGSWTISRCP